MLGTDDGDCGVDFCGAEGVEGMGRESGCSDLVGELLDAVENHCVCLAFAGSGNEGESWEGHILRQRCIYIYPSPPQPWLDVYAYNTCISVIVDKIRIVSPYRV